MRTGLAFLFLGMALISFAQNSGAVTLRYALIVGNNVGVDANGDEPYPPLKHSEHEASLLKEALVKLSNFDNTNQRTQLLTGATGDEVRLAIRALVRRKEADRRLFGRTKTLFLFYFTGHGMAGEILLEDGPLTAAEIGEMFRAIDADFSVGVFDACYSGSLQSGVLDAKGLVPMPGLDLFRELPEEILSAEGSIWYVSSGPGQASYEDESIGGVFTYFFIEALHTAPTEGPGITLDRIWAYARQHTVEFTTARNRRQVPEQFVSRLKTNAPIYFSFPLERSATLVMSESIEGTFILSYNLGQLTEVIHKQRGTEKKIALYPGYARLLLLEAGKVRTIRTLQLKEDASLQLRDLNEEVPQTSIGEHSVKLWEKGLEQERTIAAFTVHPGMSILGGLAYGYTYSGDGLLLPKHVVDASLRFDHAHVVLGGRIGYGFDGRTNPSWAYVAHSLVFGAGVGYGIDLARTRLTLGGELGAASMWQTYSNQKRRHEVAFQPALLANLLVSTNRRLYFAVFAKAGPTYSPGDAEADENYWYFSFGGGVSLYYRWR